MREIKLRYRLETPDGKVQMACVGIDWVELGKLTGKLISRDLYTGRKDKNGVEIYEGDIVKLPHSLEGNYEVKFDKGFWRIGKDDLWSYTNRPERFKIEVIGNIYENPDLLTVPPQSKGEEDDKTPA